ncbi:hypothetical protein JAAARDRAFT_58185 [Jaapia argillacea MUCL 33604]|uniref:Uncharacterized protein n=1 Tax=Jaapia argillacea MUCL 33604 TaxID=933084 RepID=A0A067Q4R8_9AGAM|nr:hypothetical protein JAAARDRAFT_58185 [Jaapia argillacea MUCL 33604]
MAPARSQNRNNRGKEPARASTSNLNDGTITGDLFLEPMMGSPLSLYIEKDVADRDVLVELVTKNGGVVAPGYSGVPYILVDPHKESGQNLYRQYVGKKGKIVLDARWINECVKAGGLQTYQTNFAGCKVTGEEQYVLVFIHLSHLKSLVFRVPPPEPQFPDLRRPMHQDPRMEEISHPQSTQAMTSHPQMMAPPAMPSAPPDGLVHPSAGSFPYAVYPQTIHAAPRAMHPATAAPPQSWQAPNGIAPQQTHMPPSQAHLIPRPHPFEEGRWNEGYHQPQPAPMVPTAPAPYDYRYRDDQAAWGVGTSTEYYEQSYQQPYEEPAPYVSEAGPSNTETSMVVDETSDRPRGRKRTRTQSVPAPPAASLVMNRRNPPARSPTPPTRVIKSTYGGNLFTSDDVLYLKKYIDYCQEQGLVLSLREICERIAIKVGHIVKFYSWRRYCNKHQIRLGGYVMDGGRSPSPEGEGQEQEPEVEEEVPRTGVGPGAILAARQRAQAEGNAPRTRSPTPPRALFRSTTGKGVAFTEEDVTFLVRFLAYRKAQGRLDMVAFWKDVANKAPHHSRASWMKFWRRHKHELEHTETDEPLPAPPEKKMRYSREDDVLLAKYFATKPEGTSDKVFQTFARMHPHHPWKGWQEHHRIHKAKIDHLIQRLANGEMIDELTT